MPLFEYKCEKCDKSFELIRNASETDSVACPSCGHPATKQLSVIAKPTMSSPSKPTGGGAPRGGCGSGTCGFGGGCY